jgi:prepilin-type N-terminal cleavage/methylation domain-containing protein
MEPMTTPSSRRKLTARRAFPAQSRRAFTLMELLVVIGIMVVLMAILLPMLSKARANAQRAAIASDLIGIAQALAQYKHDFGDYPRMSDQTPISVNGTAAAGGPSTGAVVLCWALIAPGPALINGSKTQVFDGADGPGFRTRAIVDSSGHVQGKVYGSYLNVDHYRYGTLKTGMPAGSPALELAPPATAVDDSNTMIADSAGNAILYFPGNSQVRPQAPSTASLVTQAKIGTQPSPTTLFVYNYNDNSSDGNPVLGPLTGTTLSPMCSLTPNLLAMQLGDKGPSPLIVPYLLLSAGHDGRFGPSISNGTAMGDDDDVAYPDQLNPIVEGTTP